MLPKILIMGKLYWAGTKSEEMFNGVGELLYMESGSRQELFDDLNSGGRYGDIVGVYHEHLSAKVVGHPDKEMMQAFPESCKWFAHKGAGYDAVDVATAKSRGIKVSNTPGAVDEATATTAVYLLLATMRRFSECEARLRAGSFPPPKHIEADARDLSGKTIGILGMGGIGTTFVNFIRPFGMRMLYHNRRKNASAPQDVQYISNLYDMLRQVDVLVVSIPLNDATRGYMGEKEIRSMKKGSIIVNTARGPIIDEEAMIRALQDGHLGSVGLDVFTKEPQVDQRLIDMPHITLLPHVGTENRDAREKMELVALQNLRDYLVEGTGKTVVPECM